jgi:hypothetical protein
VALLAVLCLVSGGVWVAVALAANPVPSPTITAEPANPTNVTSPSFSYTETNSVTLVRFECQLDGGGFSACGTSRPSTKAYPAQSPGSHTFQVRAVTKSPGPAGTSDPTSYTWTIDTSPPTVSSIKTVPPAAGPTNAGSVSWTVKFSEPVTGVASNGSNFSLNSSGFSGSPAVTGASGSGDTYTVTANTDGATTTDSASEQLRLSSAGSIKDLAGNGLTGVPFTTGQAYTVDKHPPTVVSINRADANPVNASASSVHWTVTFSEPVTGVASANFALTTSGFSSAPSVSGVSGSGAVWTVTASTDTATLSGPGSEQLRMTSASGVKDVLGNAMSSSGLPFAGQTYTVYRTAPPAPTIISKPSSPSRSTSASFRFADDPDNDNDSGENDSDDLGLVTLYCSINGSAFTACTSPVSYGSPPLVQGTNTFKVEAKDPAGNVSPVTTYTWTIDSVPPTTPVFSTKPANPTIIGGSSTNVSFVWSSTDPAPGTGVAGYICQLDSNLPYACATSSTFSVGLGSHTFRVLAYDNAGNFSNVASYTWTVQQNALQPVTISGNATGKVYPGAPPTPQPFATTFTNPNSVAVTITSLTVALGAMPSGCQAGWFAITQSNVSASQPITVPANGSVTLPDSTHAPGVTAPTVSMSDSGDQTNCETKMVPVTYNGTYAASFQVGSTTPFTVTIGPLTGGPLMPTSRTSGNKVVDTVQVTVTNNDSGAENLHQLSFGITSGWKAMLAGHPNCTANDFSIDGLALGATHTVVYDNNIAGGAHVVHSFTLQLVDTGLDQNACEGAHVSLTVNAS